MPEPVLHREESNDVAYEFTETAFRKTSKLPFPGVRPDGTPYIWKRSWNHERVGNEARALHLIARETTIPVPRLLEHGTYEDGRQYLVTELIPGTNMGDLCYRSCQQPEGKKHNRDEICQVCMDTAYSNALKFLDTVVFSQLERLKSKERGLDGFVMPPHWLSLDVLCPWRGNNTAWSTWPLQTPEYVFQHGDIAPHNFIVDPETLEVRGLIDWEYAGYFPRNMEKWPGSFDRKLYYSTTADVNSWIAEFLAVEFIEAYDRWENKDELKKFIEDGEMPDPELLRASTEKDTTEIIP